MLPGTHNLQPETIAVQNWAEFRHAITRLRRRFPLITRNPSFLKHDRETFKTDLPVIYSLVFRGQTKEYIDPQSGRPLLLPNAFRPGVRPAWVHRGPPGLWGELLPFFFDKNLAPPPFEPLTEDDVSQIEAYHEALLNYCLHLMGVTEPAKFKARLESWEPAGDLESMLNSVALRSTVTRQHDCVLWGGPTPIPLLDPLLRDLAPASTIFSPSGPAHSPMMRWCGISGTATCVSSFGSMRNSSPLSWPSCSIMDCQPKLST